MSEKKNDQAWILSGDFWEAIRGDIPKKARDPAKKYRNAPGQGRKPVAAGKAPEGLVHVLRTGCQWKALPREYGSGRTGHRKLQDWPAAGFFGKIWSKGPDRYDETEGIGREWQSPDGCMVKAPPAPESAGKNPADRGKTGTKRSVLTNEKGLSPAIVISGSDTHEVRLLEGTLNPIVVPRPEPDGKHPQTLCPDAGCTGRGEAVKQRRYSPHIRPRGEEKKEPERSPGFRAHRRAAEVHTLFSIASANSRSAVKRKRPAAWPYFNWPAPSLSGVSSFGFIAIENDKIIVNDFKILL